MSKHSLYLCYFGLREPLVQTQVLPYLREIKKMDGLRVSLLTFEPDFHEKWTAEDIMAEREKLAAENISWHCLPYHKRPSVPATVYDIFSGAYFAWKKIRRERVDLIHARVHVPAVMGALAKKLTFGKKPKLLFDIRGFTAEEYTDAGIWEENGLIYKTFKRIERWLFRESDGFVVLTEKAREILFPESRETNFDRTGKPVEVIPCCVDFDNRFQNDQTSMRKNLRERLSIGDRLVITHLGALGGLYLTEQLADFLKTARDRYPDVFAMFLTQTDPELIIPLLKERGFTERDFFVKRVAPTEVQDYLSASDVALSFVKASYATLSRSPTKIPEYLACGLPVVSNRGVGDVDELIINDGIGIIVDDFKPVDYLAALEEAIALRRENDFLEKSQMSAKKRFDLDAVGGTRYRRLYGRLLNGSRDNS